MQIEAKRRSFASSNPPSLHPPPARRPSSSPSLALAFLNTFLIVPAPPVLSFIIAVLCTFFSPPSSPSASLVLSFSLHLVLSLSLSPSFFLFTSGQAGRVAVLCYYYYESVTKIRIIIFPESRSSVLDE